MQTTISDAKKAFVKQYEQQMQAAGNNLMVGITRDFITDKPMIAVRLENANGQNALPDIFMGYKLDIIVIGKVRPL